MFVFAAVSLIDLDGTNTWPRGPRTTKPLRFAPLCACLLAPQSATRVRFLAAFFFLQRAFFLALSKLFPARHLQRFHVAKQASC